MGRAVLAERKAPEASFLKRDGSVWSTDKDGLILGLLAAEITARTGKDPGEHYKELTAEFGTPYYTRIDAPATPDQKNSLKKLSPEAVTATELAGEADTRTRQQCINGWLESRFGEWLVRRPSVRDREYLQTLRGKPQKRRSPHRHSGSGSGDRQSFPRREVNHIPPRFPAGPHARTGLVAPRKSGISDRSESQLFDGPTLHATLG